MSLLQFYNPLITRASRNIKKDFTPNAEKFSSDQTRKLPKKEVKSLVYSPTKPIFL